jgi:hypothetical protein
MDLFAVVTRAEMAPSGKTIAHAYGPFTRKKALAFRRKMRREAAGSGYQIEAHVCKLIDPEGESDVQVTATATLEGGAVPPVGRGRSAPEHGGASRGAGSGSANPALLDANDGTEGSGALE